ncbi:hypothetical protein [Aquimarina atlantica]|nr:hypothetical protein [Aquimarina atlantica]
MKIQQYDYIIKYLGLFLIHLSYQSFLSIKTSIVDVKTNAGKAAAVRTGAKYLNSREDIKCIEILL